MTYAESEQTIRRLRYPNEVMFRMAVSHLMDVGIRHLTEESIKSTCEEIMKEDDSKSFMTNAFKCELIKLAGELAKIDHVHLLTYISRNVEYDVGDNKPSYYMALEHLRNCIDCICRDFSYDPYATLRNCCYFDDADFIALGIEELLPDEEEEMEDE
jgi:hypothetical protein